MGRICLVRATGKILEYQPHAAAGTVLQNALNAGFLAIDLEEREITQVEYTVLAGAQPLDSVTAIMKVKAEAQRRILTRLPGATQENYRDKELNYLGRQAELDALVLGTYRDNAGVLQPARTLTAAEIAEIAVFSAFWDWVKANRIASNLIEADWQALGYAANFDYINNVRWPI